jgi:hypothetical protein
MDDKIVISKMQQAIWFLKKAEALIDEIDGMGDYVDHIDHAIEDLEQEIEELSSIQEA